MTRQEFIELTQKGLVFLDGATGSNLQSAGMPTGVCPEAWILEHPDVLIQLQRDFINAGTNIVYAPTFTGNRIKLAEYHLEDKLVEMNTQLIQLSKQAAEGRALVAADMTMTGQQLYPIGKMQFEELVDIYKEQADALYKAGADLFVVETMMSLQETRAAVIAIRETCDLPILATLTFESDGRTLFGTPPECVPTVLQGLGADAIGLNCSTGPDKMKELVEKLYEYANVPVIAKPNAGLPELENGKTVYRMTPTEFADACADLIDSGVRIIGGCCGTTPQHIQALTEKLKDKQPLPIKTEKMRVLASERKTVKITLGDSFRVIGERINPTGKKALQAELREGKLEIVRKMAREQEKAGASILDINVGTNGIDEKQTMLNVVNEVTQITDLPLCIDSSYTEVIEEALRIYPGRALINSISFESEKFKKLLPVAKKYGAMFIFLPVSDEGIPDNIEKKHQIIKEALSLAEEQGLCKKDMVVDALVATVGADPQSALHCAATFEFCQNLDLATVCGLSNISFGLPERSFVNAAFLVMSISKGLTMAIANPSQDLLMNSAAAADMLMNRNGSDLAYINRMKYYTEKREKEQAMAQLNPTATANPVKKESVTGSAESSEENNPVFKAVLDGEKDTVVDLTKAELAKGTKPNDIINEYLIPAINKVGVLFDQKKYFLPQLIASANTMETSIAYLEPMLEGGGDKSNAPVIVIATVEGDVHDIGKNLVALMLRNYGYNVIDMGKDVPAEDIINTALENHAVVVALSALMTTTMMNMKEVIAVAKDKGYDGKIIVGGAAVTESFAEEIGADGYSTDAADCVRLVQELLA